ncbi:MAG: response regulator [Brevundimonas sp.]|uniref:response regulator n=1 Tax=Brevundimonas sp. TaxID=1871086 RepID=UPI001A2FD765|nr:response regulator [Brevundimonas sp.]MBJ7446232.1 response regulator [Brevundimonas sp.]
MTTSTVPYALAVDDDVIIRMDARAILEEAGFRCMDAESGDDALEVLEQHASSVVVLFTDVEMPGSVNGFALARHVADRWPHIEIVVSSGNVQPLTGEMPAKAAFITKPFSAEVVHEELRRLLPDGKKPDPLKIAV